MTRMLQVNVAVNSPIGVT